MVDPTSVSSSSFAAALPPPSMPIVGASSWALARRAPTRSTPPVTLSHTNVCLSTVLVRASAASKLPPSGLSGCIEARVEDRSVLAPPSSDAAPPLPALRGVRRPERFECAEPRRREREAAMARRAQGESGGATPGCSAAPATKVGGERRSPALTVAPVLAAPMRGLPCNVASFMLPSTGRLGLLPPVSSEPPLDAPIDGLGLKGLEERLAKGLALRGGVPSRRAGSSSSLPGNSMCTGLWRGVRARTSSALPPPDRLCMPCPLSGLATSPAPAPCHDSPPEGEVAATDRRGLRDAVLWRPTDGSATSCPLPACFLPAELGRDADPAAAR